MTTSVRTAMDLLVIANDARYLFKQLCKSSEAESISISKTTEQILDWLRNHAAKSPKSCKELLDRYLHLVALHLHRGASELKSEHLPRVQWVREFVALMLESSQPTTTRSVMAIEAQSMLQRSPIAAASNDTRKTLILPGE